ncbi:hypothetical protein os1_32560 [Comamonadaceae bacterium OS-1]|nr:hypothetical protein os1_32560 [Comamonadaceae bacterium OS-1]
MNAFKLKIHRWIYIGAMATFLTACASGGPRVVDHSFQFDAVWDSPEIEILDFKYGDSKLPGLRTPDWVFKTTGRSFQNTSVSGPMIVGDSLYVKWQIRSTGEIYQDTVDLRQRLPRDVEDHIVRFVVKGSQLSIYVIAREKLNPNPCMLHGDPRELAKITGKSDDKVYGIFCSSQILKIYPEVKILP